MVCVVLLHRSLGQRPGSQTLLTFYGVIACQPPCRRIDQLPLLANRLVKKGDWHIYLSKRRNMQGFAWFCDMPEQQPAGKVQRAGRSLRCKLQRIELVVVGHRHVTNSGSRALALASLAKWWKNAACPPRGAATGVIQPSMPTASTIRRRMMKMPWRPGWSSKSRGSMWPAAARHPVGSAKVWPAPRPRNCTRATIECVAGWTS